MAYPVASVDTLGVLHLPLYRVEMVTVDKNRLVRSRTSQQCAESVKRVHGTTSVDYRAHGDI